MKIKKLLVKNKFKPHFTYSQIGTVNRLFLNVNDLVVCETRDLKLKEVFFFSLNYRTKEIFLKNYQMDEKWWVSIENVNSDTIFMHTFKKPDLPEPIGIFAVDIKTGKLKWKNDELIFFFATDKDVYAFKQHFEKNVYYRLNAFTGSAEEEYGDESSSFYLINLRDKQEKIQYFNCMYTEIFNGETEFIENEIKEYLNKRFAQTKTFGEIEYIRYGNYLIYNFHSIKGINLKNINESFYLNRLEIYDLIKKQLVLEEVLNSSVSNYVPDSFFIKDNFLFYIKEKKELVTVNLKING